MKRILLVFILLVLCVPISVQGAVVAGDLLLYKATSIPSDDTSTTGGAITGTQTSALGDIFAPFSAIGNAEGGADKTFYGKVFYKNTNGSDSLSNARVYIKNGLDQPSAATTITVISSSASDDTTHQVQIYGEDASANFITEIIPMNGTTNVVGIVSFTKIWRAEYQVRNTGVVTSTHGTVSIKKTITLLGIIPASTSWATAEFAIGLSTTLDDTDTVSNRITTPTGGSTPASYTSPNTFTGSLAVANGGVLTTGTAQGIWVKMTVPSGMPNVGIGGALLQLTLSSGSVPPDSFLYSKVITYDTTAEAHITANITDRPIKIIINSNSWPTAGDRSNFFNDTYNPNGKRIRFYTYDRSTPISYCVLYYSTANQEAVYEVEIPTLLHDGDTNYATRNFITVAYGNDPLEADQDSCAGTYSNAYTGVYPLSGNYQVANDILGNYNGTNSGSTQAAGQLTFNTTDGARSFDGNDEITFGNQVLSLGNKTIEGWIKTSSTSDGIIDNCGTSGANRGTSIYLAADGKLLFYSTNAGTRFSVTSASAINDGAWHYFMATWDGSTASNHVYLYIDMASAVTGTASSTEASAASNNLKFGNLGAPYPTGYFYTGSLANVSIGTYRSSLADWRTISYYSMAIETSWNGDYWLTWDNDGGVEDVTQTKNAYYDYTMVGRTKDAFYNYNNVTAKDANVSILVKEPLSRVQVLAPRGDGYADKYRSLYASVEREPDGYFRMWYLGWDNATSTAYPAILYAESPTGEAGSWVRPDLKNTGDYLGTLRSADKTWAASAANNIVYLYTDLPTGDALSMFTIVKDSTEDNADRRYKMLITEYNSAGSPYYYGLGYYSPDGINWTANANNPLWNSNSIPGSTSQILTHSTMLYNSDASLWEVFAQCSKTGTPVQREWCQLNSSDDLATDLTKYGRFTDTGGIMHGGAFFYENGVHYSPTEIWGGASVSGIRLWETTGKWALKEVDATQYFIPLGTATGWDDEFVTTPAGLTYIPILEEHWLYYGGCNQGQDDGNWLTCDCSTGLAKWPVNGFTEIGLTSGTDGTFTTGLYSTSALAGKTLWVNTSCVDAENITVELLDIDSNAITNYEETDCDAMTLENRKRQVTWNSSASLSGTGEDYFKIKFYLNGADCVIRSYEFITVTDFSWGTIIKAN